MRAAQEPEFVSEVIDDLGVVIENLVGLAVAMFEARRRLSLRIFRATTISKRYVLFLILRRPGNPNFALRVSSFDTIQLFN